MLSNRKQFGLYERQGTRLEPMACKGSGVRISVPPQIWPCLMRLVEFRGEPQASRYVLLGALIRRLSRR
jgi:hypothetical protein